MAVAQTRETRLRTLQLHFHGGNTGSIPVGRASSPRRGPAERGHAHSGGQPWKCHLSKHADKLVDACAAAYATVAISHQQG